MDRLKSMKNTIYNHPTEWLKKPLSCPGASGQSSNVLNKRTCENQTLLEAIALIKNDAK